MNARVVDLDGPIWFEDGHFEVANGEARVTLAEGAWVVDKTMLHQRLGFPRWRQGSPLVDVDLTGGKRGEPKDPKQALAAGFLLTLGEFEANQGIEAASPEGYAAYWCSKGARIGRKLDGEVLWYVP